MIELINVEKSYNKKIKAVDKINLTVNPGEIFGFLGPNGAGKTTTIKMITGVLSLDNGQIKVNGQNIKEKPIEVKKQIGFVPDNPDMFLRLKGMEYLNFMADIYEVPLKKRKERIKSLTEKFEIQDVLMDAIQSYSHGMRQKIVIIGALLSEPSVWILDEPMTGLDPKSSFLLKEMMRDHVKAGKTLFFSTHVLDVAEKICDKVAIINKGQILYCGTIKDMKKENLTNESLEEMFLEMTE